VAAHEAVTGPARAYLALGSNIGDKAGNLRAATIAIAALPQTRVIARSAFYRTPPWGKTDQAWFANAVIAVETGLAPHALLEACLAIEIAQGRIRRERWGPRVIDIDLLLHGTATITTERLTLPHPAMLARAFVLVPLAEIAPGLVLEGEPIATRLAALDRDGIVPLET
jgi:2-amino-4-hydroxy-6-hydroxymethyldihydropteridine diphosphokinase